MSTVSETAIDTATAAPYVCASIPAWREQTRAATAQGQTVAAFLSHCHPLNRTNARAAYLMEQTTTETAEEAEVRAIVENGDRNTIIKAIRDALKKRSGKAWSVTGGSGTAYGWIRIDAPPSRRICHVRRKADAVADRPEDYEEYEDPARPGGSMTRADRAELASLLGKEDATHVQGESIPADYSHRREYLHRALHGHPGNFRGRDYWD